MSFSNRYIILRFSSTVFFFLLHSVSQVFFCPGQLCMDAGNFPWKPDCNENNGTWINVAKKTWITKGQFSIPFLQLICEVQTIASPLGNANWKTLSNFRSSDATNARAMHSKEASPDGLLFLAFFGVFWYIQEGIGRASHKDAPVQGIRHNIFSQLYPV